MTDIKRFYKNRTYIGILHRHIDLRGVWQDDISIALINGIPYRKTVWDNIIEYTPAAWEYQKRLIEEQAMEYNRDVIVKTDCIFQAPRWDTIIKGALCSE